MKNKFEENGYEYGTVMDALLGYLSYLPKDTVKMISKADNFEIYPRTDGTLQLNITFQAILKAI